MALGAHHKANFETLRRAFAHSDAAILECRQRATGAIRAVVVAVEPREKGQEFRFVPFAVLIDGDPYAAFDPPDPDGPGFLVDKGRGGR